VHALIDGQPGKQDDGYRMFGEFLGGRAGQILERDRTGCERE
jgi:hypothetical protein